MSTLTVTNLPIASPALLPNSSTQQSQQCNDVAGATGVASSFFAPLAGATSKITKIGVHVSSITGTGATYRFSLQGVTSAGIPDGTIKSGSGSNDVYVDVAISAAGFSGWHTLGGSGYSPTINEALCAVVTGQSGANESNNATLGYGATTVQVPCQPTGLYCSASTWTVSARYPLVVVQYADNTIPLGMIPLMTGTSQTWNNTSDPLYRGIKWTPQQTCRLRGVWIAIRVNSASDFKVNMFAGAPNAGATITSGTIDASQMFNSANVYHAFVPLPLTTLTAGTPYRIVVEPTTSTSFQGSFYFTFYDKPSIDAVYGELYGTTAQAADASWTDYDSGVNGYRMYAVIPVIDTITPTPPNYPDESEVEDGVTYGTTGSEEYEGTLEIPAEADVQEGVTYGGGGALTGTFVSPDESNVASGVGYGDSSEFTGTLDPGSETQSAAIETPQYLGDFAEDSTLCVMWNTKA